MGGSGQADGLLCSLHPTLFSWRGPGPGPLHLGASLPISWVPAAKVGPEDAAQQKLSGLGEDHGQKGTPTILLSCRMTPPCSHDYAAIGAVPPRCRNCVPPATSCRTTPRPTIANGSHS